MCATDHRTSCNMSLRNQRARWLWQSASPVPKGPLPKGPWHGEAVTEGFHAGTFLQPSVGADDPVAVPKIFALPYGERLKF